MLGRHEEALQSVNQALEINPKDPVGWYGHGAMLYYLGRGREALQSFAKVLTINPDFYKAWFDVGTIFLEQGLDNEAVESFDFGIQRNPNIPEPWNNRGVALMNSADMTRHWHPLRKRLKLSRVFVSRRRTSNLCRGKNNGDMDFPAITL